VDFVAGVTVSSAIHPPMGSVMVAQITGRPRMLLSELLGSLAKYGYDVRPTDYETWKNALEVAVGQGKDNALYPLLHFVSDDLPTNSKAPDLDDTSTQYLLTTSPYSSRKTSLGVNEHELAIYIAYLVEIGFLEPPKNKGKPLPHILISSAIKRNLQNVGGRGTKK